MGRNTIRAWRLGLTMAVIAAMAAFGSATVPAQSATAPPIVKITTETGYPPSSGWHVLSASDEPLPTLLLLRDGTAPDDTDRMYLTSSPFASPRPVALAPGGVPLNGRAAGGRLSDNGRFVTFWTEASNLAPDDVNGYGDVFVRDLQTEQVSLVTQSTTGARAEFGGYPGDVSDDGRFVVFTSNAPLDPDRVAPTGLNVFLRDTVVGTTTRISTGTYDSGDNITPDGRYITYTSYDLLRDTSETIRYDRVTGQREIVVPRGQQGYAVGASISRDGNLVAFYSADDSLVEGDNNGIQDVFVAEVDTGAITRISVDPDGNQITVPNPNIFDSYYSAPQISASGRFVTFSTSLSQFAPDLEGTRSDYDVFVIDLVEGTTTLTSQGLPSAQGPVMAGEQAVFFESFDEPATGGDTFADVFSAEVLSAAPAASPAARYVPTPPQRLAQAVPIAARETIYLDLAGALPADATSAALNVTVSGVTERSYVSVCPATLASEHCRATSVVNPYPARDVANLALPQVGDGLIQIYNNEGASLVSVDLVGYFRTGGTGTLDFKPQTPSRDTEVLQLSGGQTATVNLDGVPAGAKAAAVRVTAASVTGNTYLSVCPVGVTGAACTGTSTLNPNQRDTSNLAIVPIDPATGNAITVYNNVGNAVVYTDVTGYFVTSGTGSRFVAQPPSRVLKDRTLGAGQTYALPGPGAGVTAWAANVTAAGATATTFVSVCPGNTAAATCRKTSTVNPYASQDTASSTLVQLNPSMGLLYYNNLGSLLLYTDVQGYFVP